MPPQTANTVNTANTANTVNTANSAGGLMRAKIGKPGTAGGGNPPNQNVLPSTAQTTINGGNKQQL